MNRNAPVAQLDRALPSEGKGHTFESCRVRQLRCRRPRWRVASSRILAATPASLWLPTKNIENNPMQSSMAVAGKDALGQYLTRRANQGHSFIIAQSVKRPWSYDSAPRSDFGETPYPQLK